MMDILAEGGAYIVEGAEEKVEALAQEIARAGLPGTGHPDFYARSYASLGIGEARELRERARTRPIAGSHRVFLIAAANATVEAQNALLKTFEEPPAGAIFFFITPAPHMLLPTLRSRLLPYVPRESAVQLDRKVQPDAFLEATPAKRLELLKVFFPPERGKHVRDTGAMLDFLAALERELDEREDREGRDECLAAVYRARAYIQDKGALQKPLLEQVALLC